MLTGNAKARVLQLLLTSCLQGCNGTAFNLFSNWSFPHTPCSFPLSVSCRRLSRHSVRTSWEFSLGQVGIYQVTYLLGGRMKVPHLMSIRPMESWLATLNASSATVSHALEQVTAARIGVICECFNWSSLFACKAVTVQLSICFPISLSRIRFAASLYLCPADCFQDILFEQAGNSHWNKLELTSLPPTRMRVTHLMSIGPNM